MSIKSVPCIEAKNLHYKVGESLILEDVSFEIKTGDYVGIIGPNGAGKTTLLRILLGLIKPTVGEVTIFGQPIQNSNPFAYIGYVPQKAAQTLNNFPTTVEEVVKSGRTVRRGYFSRWNHKDETAISRAMEATGVLKYRRKAMSELSGGQKQRVFIARALAGEPKILILDEPTTGVDIGHQEKFYEFLRELRSKLNLTIIFVTHDIDFIAKEVSNVLCLNQKLVCHQSPKDFLTQGNLEKVYGQNSKAVLHHH
jgi:zinc transport system ATP-binding protein